MNNEIPSIDKTKETDRPQTSDTTDIKAIKGPQLKFLLPNPHIQTGNVLQPNLLEDQMECDPIRDAMDHTKCKLHIRGSNLNASTLRSHIILNPVRGELADKRVIFFDLDNTMYSKNTGIAEMVGRRIELFFTTFLGVPREEAALLGRRYYLDYGLAIRGLIQNFQIDPIQYDSFVDGGLDFEGVLKPSPVLNAMLERMEARRWIFTNAGINHALRVLEHLQCGHLFEGIVYCDYSEPDFPAKPDRLAYERAMLSAGIGGRPDLCSFVDDSVNNVRTALELGWRAVYLDERGDAGSGRDTPNPITKDIPTTSDLLSLPKFLPDIFRESDL